MTSLADNFWVDRVSCGKVENIEFYVENADQSGKQNSDNTSLLCKEMYHCTVDQTLKSISNATKAK